ncbi:hypothetical protein BH09MYX1_BH09MYX1_42330 [soil metagenome]
MDGKEKIERLTNSWYGFGLFTGVASFLFNGIGIFSMIGAGISIFVSFCITFVLGRLLLRKSSVTRFGLIVVSGLFSVLGVLGIGSAIWTFFGEWSLSLLVGAAYATIAIYQHVKSINVLTDKSVKSYFA